MVITLVLVVAVAIQGEGTKKLSDVARGIFSIRLNTLASALALAIIVFALVSLLWSPAPARGLGAVTGASTAALVSVYCCSLVARHITIPCWLVWVLPLAIVSSSLLVVSELALGSPIRSALGASTQGFRLNRAAVSVALMLPLLFLHDGGKKRLCISLAVFSLACIAIFFSESESAKLAVLAAAGALLVANVMSSRWLVIFCGIGLVASHVIAPFIAVALYTLIPRQAVEAMSIALSQSPTHLIRVEIWWAYALQILEAPIFGHGLQASPMALDVYSGFDAAVIRGLSLTHPHNFSIQVWYELGVVGIALSSAMLLLLLRCVLRAPAGQQKVAVGLLAALWTVAYVSHGAWQHWWWALVGVTVVLFVALKESVI